MNKAIAKAWTMPSGSSPSKTYQTLQYEDGSTSCDCMGWTRHVASDGSRCCRHTRAVDIGTADSMAVSSHDYQNQTTVAPVRAKAKPARPIPVEAAPVVRKIQWK
jgi:hypothetical protein